MSDIEFKPWPKIPRQSSKDRVIITEKIDGTNACIIIQDGRIAGTQSRKRFITPEDDNYGFSGWVSRNEEELLSLGEGYHYGEWAGLGIQKNPMNLDRKMFFLFNTLRWGPHNENTPGICKVVPVLYDGEDYPEVIEECMLELRKLSYDDGLKREGIVSFYPKTQRMMKTTFEFSEGKWKTEV